ncbi:MAG TPA: ABC transporter permease [Candidatus Scybalocola faecavium]|nr:ABC transporter permease [Candidatus Scybalocola faecavium]
MGFKLALKNARRQAGNYAVYFITVTMSVALIFAINNVICNRQLQVFADTVKELGQGLDMLIWFIALVMVFVLGYGTSFMLKLRKREFGTYMILGMKRKNVMTIFMFETLILDGAALVCGILLGLGVYQAMMLIVCSIMEVPPMFSVYSGRAFFMTVLMVAVIFILASFASGLYLRKVTIRELLKGTEKKSKKPTDHPWLWFFLGFCCLGLMILSVLFFSREMDRWAATVNRNASWIFSLIFLFGIGIFGFHLALAKCLMYVLMKNKKLCSRGTNIFLLRQLWSQLGTNALMAGFLSVLITFAVAGANVSFTQKTSAQASLDRTVPFDIVGCLDMSREHAYDFDTATALIRDKVPVKEMLDYNVYTDGTRPVTQAVGFTVAYDMNSPAWEEFGPPDYYISLSDFNRFARALGRDALPEDGRFYLVSDMSLELEIEGGFTLEKNGLTAEYGGFIGSFPRVAFVYYTVIVPDEMIRGMDIAYKYRCFTLEDVPFDAQALSQALTYIDENSAFGPEERCDYQIKACIRMEDNSTSAMIVVAALYIAMIFIFMAMAILALKTLAGINDDRRRYKALYRIGAGPKVLYQTLFRQILIFFFFPAVLPLALSLVIAWMCEKIISVSGFPQLSGSVYVNGAMIALVILGVYVLYFFAAWQIGKRNVFSGE